MRKPLENTRIFADRRAKLASEIPGSVVIVASPPEYFRNGTVHYSFRQDSNMYYLTGFEEPESIFVFRPGQTPESVMFVRKKDPARETWDGFRYGPEEAQNAFKMDKVYPIEEFDKQIVGLLKGSDKLYYRFFKNPEMDNKIQSALLNLKNSQGRTGYGLLPVFDSEELIGELRLFKTPADLENHRRACEITAESHIETMKYVKPGLNEKEIYGYFLYQIMKRGCTREGYGGIFASGPNACILHYVFNDQPLKNGELILIDAAGEYNYFSSDITRTYPINGKFTDEQAEVYNGVLKVQKTIIESVRPGMLFQEMQEMSVNLLTELMLELGLLTGRKEDVMKTNENRKYYPHNVSHFLGMDVHDAGLYYSKKGDQRRIESGMVFTVEPGLYIPAEDKEAAKEYRGIGVRIEDDILVTPSGAEVLTKKCPKEISDLEKLIGTY